MPDRILVVGGNAAGMTAASRAKRLDPSLDITVLEAGPRIAYSICGLPYFLSRRVPELRELELFTPETLMNERGIEAKLLANVAELRPTQRRVIVDLTSAGGSVRREVLGYDRLLLATGYRPKTPDVEGMDGNGVFTASRLGDGDAIASWLESRGARRAVVVGAGYVGLEMAEALVSRGIEVTIVEGATQVFPSIDPDVAEPIQEILERRGVRVLLGRRAKRVQATSDGGVEAVELESGSLRLPAELVFVDVGVEPRTELARDAGLTLGAGGAVAVDEYLETSAHGVYAAGNCAETLHLVSGQTTPIALGTVAAKQGRIAGENLAGRRSRFLGAVGTSVVQVFGLAVARTGLSTEEAKWAGFDPVSSTIEGRFRAHYFEGGAPAHVKVIADRASRRLLGVQIVGSPEGASRIDAAAVALTARMTVSEASQLDLGYAPPMGALWNPVLVAMNALLRDL